MSETLEVFSPIGVEVVTKGKSAPRLETLDGKTVGETWNEDFKGDVTFPVYRETLDSGYTHFATREITLPAAWETLLAGRKA